MGINWQEELDNFYVAEAFKKHWYMPSPIYFHPHRSVQKSLIICILSFRTFQVTR